VSISSFPKQSVHSGVQVNHHSEGLSIDWEYLKKLHPAIHIICAIASHLEQEFLTLMRGKKHTTPKKELDIKTFQESYHKACIHNYESGQKIAGRRDRAKDITTLGALAMMSGAIITRWVDSRSFTRLMTQDWELLSDSDDTDGLDQDNLGAM
jgi:hypothetical protein